MTAIALLAFPFYDMDMMCPYIVLKITHYKQKLSGNIFPSKNKSILFKDSDKRHNVPRIANANGDINDRFRVDPGNGSTSNMLDIH